MAERPEDVEDQVDEDYDPEAEVVGNWKKVDLPECTLKTGEEDDEELTKFRTKLYRFRNGEWKERGVGELKFLKNKTNGRVRLLMRAEKTHKVVINHLLQRKGIYCALEPLKTSTNSWTWAAYDISDEKPQAEKFCGKVTSPEEYQRFKTEFDKACEVNDKLIVAASEEKKETAAETKTETTTEQKKEETKAEESKKEETKTETKTEETKPEEPKKEEPKVEEPKAEEPKPQEPKPAVEEKKE